MEEWKDVVGYEEIYIVSNLGGVRSLLKNRKLKSYINRYGYEKVCLTVNKISKQKSVHRLVTEAFIPNPENKPQVNHKNGTKTDNRVENLEWCTGEENIKHSLGMRSLKYTQPEERIKKKNELSKQWRRNNPNYYKNYSKEWRKKHPNYDRERQVKFREANPNYYKEYYRKRRDKINKSSTS